MKRIIVVQKHDLPYDVNQKFQIGDIVKIVKTDCYPPIKIGYEQYFMITGSYWQCCGSRFYYKPYNKWIPSKNLNEYRVLSLNEDIRWAWIFGAQMEFVRKPTEKEKRIALNDYWDYIEKCGIQ